MNIKDFFKKPEEKPLEENTIKGMTVTTKYGIGDKIDLGAYIKILEGTFLEVGSIEISINAFVKDVHYVSDGYRYCTITLRENESDEKLLRYNGF